MKTPPKVQGKMGFDEKKKPESQEIISKEETMFRIGKDGKPISEKFPISIYDRNLDNELLEEGMSLMQLIKRQKAVNTVLQELKVKQDKDILEKKEKLSKETDEKAKKELKEEIKKLENIKEMEIIKEKINLNVTEEGIVESKEILEELDKEKERQKIIKYVELVPCNNSESYLAFEQGKTIEGKDTDDWVSDIISKKVKNPVYTLEEAKNLRLDFKIALKEALMEASNYKIKSYRDIMTEIKLSETKPLTLKKEKQNAE